MKLKVKKLHPDAIIPTYATEGSACFDLYAIDDGHVDDISHPMDILGTGLAFEIPKFYKQLAYLNRTNALYHARSNRVAKEKDTISASTLFKPFSFCSCCSTIFIIALVASNVPNPAARPPIAAREIHPKAQSP